MKATKDSKVDVAAELVNEMEAVIRLRVEPGSDSCNEVVCGVFEVGYDGSIPQAPLAVDTGTMKADGNGVTLSLRVGTPMCWSENRPYRYAALISIGDGREVCERWEISFGICSAGGLCAIDVPGAARPMPTGGRPGVPSLVIISDSTAASNWVNQLGWGDPLAALFDPTKLNVLNRARAGRSSRSFIREGLWARALAEVKAGDRVLIQFGHNDADTLDKGRCRGVLPGLGETEEAVLLPDGCRESVHTFGWYLRRMISEVRAKGARPILLSPTPKHQWVDQRLDRSQGEYGAWAAAVAMEEGVPFVDLTEKIATAYDSLGKERVAALYCCATDTVHTSPEGARLNAMLVAEALELL